MAEEIVIEIGAKSGNLNSEFGKVNQAFSFLEESAQRTARSMSREFQSAFDKASAAGRAMLSEQAKLFQERLSAARDAAREEIRLNADRQASNKRVYEDSVKAAQQAKIEKLKLLNDELVQLRRNYNDAVSVEKARADAAKSSARQTYEEKLRLARAESAELKKLQEQAAKSGVTLKDYRGSGTADPKEYYRQMADAAQKAYKTESDSINATRKARLDALKDIFSTESAQYKSRKALIEQEYNQAKKAAEDKAKIVQTQLNQELAATQRTYREKVQAAIQESREVMKIAQTVQKGLAANFSFSAIFGANFLSDLVQRGLSGLINLFKEGAVESVLYAARVEELGIALHAMAKANNVSTAATDAQVDSIKRLNITTEDARSVLTKFVAAQFEVSKANKLATVSQDLAVVVGRSTAEEFEKLTDAIQTLQTRNLRSAGVFITVDQVLDDLAKTSGRARNSFTTLEKQTAVLNAVIEYGTRVTGTYDAAMGGAAKNMRSTERLVLELKNAFGSLFQGILTNGVMALNAFLGYLDKNRNVFYLVIALVVSLTVAVIALATSLAARLVPAVTAATTAMAALGTTTAAVSATMAAASFVAWISGIGAVIAIIGIVIAAIYNMATATEDLKGANARMVDFLVLANKQLSENAAFFENLADKTNLAGEAQSRFRASLQLLTPVRAAEIQQIGENEKGVRALTDAIKAQREENEKRLKSEYIAAATAVEVQLKNTKTAYDETTKSISDYSAAQDDMLKLQDRAVKEFGMTVEEFQKIEPRGFGDKLLQFAQEGLGDDNLVSRQDKFIRQVADARERMKELETTISENAESYSKAQEAMKQFATPLAELIVRQKQMGVTTGVTGEEVLKMRLGITELTPTQREIAKVIDQTTAALEQEGNKFKQAGGAALEYVDAILQLKQAKLDVDETPEAAQEFFKGTAQSILDFRKSIVENTAPAEGGTKTGDRIAASLGLSFEELSKDDKKIDAYIAIVYKSRLRQALESAKTMKSILGEEGYEKFLQTEQGKIIDQYSKLAAESIKTADTVTDAFTGISKGGKVAATEADKLADRIKKVRAEADLLAKSGNSDAQDRVKLRQEEFRRDQILRIREAQYELGIDASKPISTDPNSLKALDTFYDRLKKIRDLKFELGQPYDPKVLPKNDDDARRVERDLERQQQLRDELFNLTERQADAEQRLAILRATLAADGVSIETRAQIKYIEMLNQRKEAEQDLTADIAVELTKRQQQNELSIQSLENTQAEVYLNRLRSQGDALKGLASSYFNLQMDLGDQSYRDNPLIEQGEKQAQQMDEQIKNGDIQITATRRTNEILETNIQTRLDQANLNSTALGNTMVRTNQALLNALAQINTSVQSASFGGGDFLGTGGIVVNRNISDAERKAVADRVLRTLISKGATETEIQAIFAAAFNESSWNPTIVGDNGQAVGLFQQHPSYINQYMGGRDLRTNPEAATIAILQEARRVQALRGAGYYAGRPGLLAADFERPAEQYRGNYQRLLPSAIRAINESRARIGAGGKITPVPTLLPDGVKPTQAEQLGAFSVDNIVENANKVQTELSKMLDKQEEQRKAIAEAQARFINELIENGLLVGDITARAQALTEAHNLASPTEVDKLKNMNAILSNPDKFGVSVQKIIDLGNGVTQVVTQTISIAERIRQNEIGKVIENEKNRRITRNLYGLDTSTLKIGFSLDQVSGLTGGGGEGYRAAIAGFLDSDAYKAKTDDQKEVILEFYQSIANAAADRAKKLEQLSQKEANAELYWLDVRQKAQDDFRTEQLEMDQRLDADQAALEEKRRQRADAGSLYNINLLRAERQERERNRDAVIDEIAALERRQRDYVGTPEQRRDIQAEGYRDRLRASQDATAEIMRLEDELANFSVGAADRYKIAWLNAIKDIKQADEDAVRSQIESQVRLADAWTVHSEQIRADVLDYMASQKTLSEAIGDSFKSMMDGVLKPFDSAIDKLTEKWGTFGEAFGGFFKAVYHQFTNRIFGGILDSLFPPTVGGTQAGGSVVGVAGVGTGAAGGITSLATQLLTGNSQTSGLLQDAVQGIADQNEISTVATATMQVRAQNVVISGLSITGGGFGGGGIGGGIFNLGGGTGGGGGIIFGGGTGGGTGGSLNFPSALLLNGRGGTGNLVSGLGGGGNLGSLITGIGGGSNTIVDPFTGFSVTGGRGNYGGLIGTPQTLTEQTLAHLNAGSGGIGGVGNQVAGRGLSGLLGGGFSLNGLAGSLVGGAPLFGAQLGGLLGGQSAGGQLLGNVGGLLGGVAGLGILSSLGLFSGILGGTAGTLAGGATAGGIFGAGSALGGLFGAGGALQIGALSAGLSASIVLAPIAAALLIGSYFYGRNQRRRQEEKQRTEILVKSKDELRKILSAVQADRMDGTEAISQAMEIRSQYLTEVGKLKDGKTRRIAQATVRELDVIIDQIKTAAAEQAQRQSYSEKFVPTYALGGQVSIATGAGVPVMDGYGKIGGAYSGRDSFIAALGEGETILTPRDVMALGGAKTMKRIGVRGYANSGVVGQVAPSPKASLSTAYGSAPIVQVTAIVVQSEQEAIELAKRIPNAIIAEKVSDNIDETGGAGLPAKIVQSYNNTY